MEDNRSFGQILEGDGFTQRMVQAAGGLVFADEHAIPALIDEFTGASSQRREFGQQEKLLGLEQEFGDERNRMNRLIEAGVNPLTAASGVAGSSSSPTAPNVPSSSGAASAGLNSLASAVDAVSNARERMSSANERDTLLEDRKKNIISDTFLKYQQAGYNKEMSIGLAISNAFLPTSEFLKIVNLTAQTDKLHAEFKDINAAVEVKKKQIDEMDAQIALYNSQGRLADAMALTESKKQLQIEADTAVTNWRLQKMTDLGIDPNNPVAQNLFVLGVENGTSSESYKTGLGIVYDTQYKSSIGGYDADKDTAHDRAYNFARGEYKGDPYQDQIRTLYDDINSSYEELEQLKTYEREILEKLQKGEISRYEASEVLAKIRSGKDFHEKFIKEYSNIFARSKYNFGHESYWQNLTKDLLRLGVTIGTIGAMKSGGKPKPVKGFRN